MRRLLPHPLQSIALLLVWLLLNNSVSAGHMALGALLAIGLPLWWQRFWPHAPKLRRPLVLAKLLAVVLWDIIVANFQVALQVLGPNARLHPTFFELPLDLDDEFAITLLASIVSLTPGTVSSDVSMQRRVILVHALDARDPQQVIATIKQRYEQPLKEALGC
jgi:multicomponent K+:H+ antiporter subunit E